MSVLGSILGAVGTVGGSLIKGPVAAVAGTALGQIAGGISSQQDFNRQLNAQIALQDRQNQFNLDMWNRQNEYNSPKAQMQRLADAGLNPNLAYGSLSGNVAMNAPQASTGGVSARYQNSDENVSDNLARIQAIANAKLAMDKQQADINKTNQEANLLQSQKQYYDNQSLLSLANLDAIGYKNQFWRMTFADRVKLMTHQNEFMESQINNVNADTIYKQVNTDIAKKDYELRKNYNAAQISLINANIKTALGELSLKYQLQPYQIKKLSEEAVNLASQSQYLRAKNKFAYQEFKSDLETQAVQRSLFGSQIDLNKFNTRINYMGPFGRYTLDPFDTLHKQR